MRQAQDHAFDYLNGLMTCPERKSVEPIALNVGHGDVSGLQKFLNCAPWDRDDVQDDIQAVFAARLAPSAAGTAVGVVGVFDESAFSKKGRHSAGVANQHNGRLDKTDNCQVGVFLLAVAPAGVRCWIINCTCRHPGAAAAPRMSRAAKARIPEGVRSGPSRRSPRT